MRRRPAASTASLAGWLFADLLLAFAIIVLGSTAGSATGDTTSTTTTTTTTSTTTTALPAPKGLSPNPITIDLPEGFRSQLAAEGDPSPELKAQLARQLETQLPPGSSVGFVIVQGNDSDVTTGERLGKRLFAALVAASPDQFRGAEKFSLKNTGVPGCAQAKVFVYT